ncbi:helix-turn-helix domain-containing protein [Streptomyces sp. NPDC091387]|uniref:helix-turn-helix domain-containing protein n=1 Tax=Streptomyces sp. NPDC091387 TaxID=3365998 RepID=UPI00382D62B3
MQWSEYTTAERLKALRNGMTQEQLAEAAEVSVGVVRKLERGGTASLPSLLSIASALGTDIAVLFGQQAPRRSMDRDERAALRSLSGATHDAALGIPAEAEPGTVDELRAVLQDADAAYWAGRYAELGVLLGALLPEAHGQRQEMMEERTRHLRGSCSVENYTIHRCDVHLLPGLAIEINHPRVGRSRYSPGPCPEPPGPFGVRQSPTGSPSIHWTRLLRHRQKGWPTGSV